MKDATTISAAVGGALRPDPYRRAIYRGVKSLLQFIHSLSAPPGLPGTDVRITNMSFKTAMPPLAHPLENVRNTNISFLSP